jgi:ABC-type oligopeptide transport system substrate-binding subunit
VLRGHRYASPEGFGVSRSNHQSTAKTSTVFHRLAITILSLTPAILLAACGSPAGTIAPSDHAVTLHRSLGGEPGSLDPARQGDTFSTAILDDVYEGLTTQAPDGSVRPGVAERWSVSPDGLTYTFELRHDARWSNGSLVRAQDFIRGWQRVLDPHEAAPEADNLRIIRGASDILAGPTRLEFRRRAMTDFASNSNPRRPISPSF